MKVNRGKLNRIYTPPISDNNIKKASSPKVSEDKVEISEEAKKYSAQKSYANIAIRDISASASAEKLQSLKNKVITGKYNISSEKIADAILDNNK